MLTMSLQQLKFEFNAEPMLTAADKATKSTLTKFGAYTQRTAKNSIKTKPQGVHSKPGAIPFGHDGITRYKDWIFYFYDHGRKEVIVGGIKLSRSDQSAAVPGVLEKGGETHVPLPWYLVPARSRGSKRPKRSVRQQSRPHMIVAYQNAAKKMLPKLLENSIKP